MQQQLARQAAQQPQQPLRQQPHCEAAPSAAGNNAAAGPGSAHAAACLSTTPAGAEGAGDAEPLEADEGEGPSRGWAGGAFSDSNGGRICSARPCMGCNLLAAVAAQHRAGNSMPLPRVLMMLWVAAIAAPALSSHCCSQPAVQCCRWPHRREGRRPRLAPAWPQRTAAPAPACLGGGQHDG
jgi:hypothetical protein